MTLSGRLFQGAIFCSSVFSYPNQASPGSAWLQQALDARGLLPPAGQLKHSSFQAALIDTRVHASLRLCPGFEKMTATLCARVRASPHATVTCLFYACTVMPGQPVGGGSFSSEKLLCIGLHPFCTQNAVETSNPCRRAALTPGRSWCSGNGRASSCERRAPGQALLGDLPR